MFLFQLQMQIRKRKIICQEAILSIRIAVNDNANQIKHHK